MAALTRHAFLGCALARCSPILSATTKVMVVPVRGKMKKPAQKPKKKATIDSIMASIEAKGFLRSYKPYQPPEDVSERIDKICEEQGISINDDTVIEDMTLRFNLFVKCEEEFNHEIPNSRLCYIETIGHLREFYKTAVFTTTPYDALENLELPPNLHIQKEPVRFHPDDDKLFGGKTAFPHNATIVSGLKYKGKYKEYKPEKPWPILIDSVLDKI